MIFLRAFKCADILSNAIEKGNCGILKLYKATNIGSYSDQYFYIAKKKKIYLSPYECNKRLFNGIQNIFYQNINKILSSLHNASLGTFCIPISQLFESHRAGSLKAQSKAMF